jgi:hypothetical protein
VPCQTRQSGEAGGGTGSSGLLTVTSWGGRAHVAWTTCLSRACSHVSSRCCRR